MVTIDALRNTELFQDLSDETLRAITDLATVAFYEDGDSVYGLGDDADDLYLVDSGRVRFSLGVGNRPDASGSVMTAGKIFGWAALLEAQPRRLATATCLETLEGARHQRPRAAANLRPRHGGGLHGHAAPGGHDRAQLYGNPLQLTAARQPIRRPPLQAAPASKSQPTVLANFRSSSVSM